MKLVPNVAASLAVALLLVGCAQDRIRDWTPSELAELRPVPAPLASIPSAELELPRLPQVTVPIARAITVLPKVTPKPKARVLVGRTGVNNPETPPPVEPPSGSPTCTVGICSLGGTCTGAAGSCSGGTCSGFTAATGLSSIQGLINGAPNDGVICLARGESWTAGGVGLTITASHPNGNRASICASTGSTCNAAGAPANPRITVTGNARCVQFSSGSGGWNMRDLDCYNGFAGATSQNAWEIQRGTSNITLTGVLSDGFFQGMMTGVSGSGSTPDNIRHGVCNGSWTGYSYNGAGAWFEVRNAPTADPGGDRQAQEGTCTNCFFSLYVHDFRATSLTCNPGNFCTSHMTDLLSNESSGQVWNQAGVEHDAIYECGKYVWTSGAFGAAVMKFNRGYGHQVRFNLFDGGTTSNAPIAIGGHGSNGQEGISGSGVPGAGLAFHDNIVIGTGGNFQNEIGQDVDINNNLYVLTSSSGLRGVLQLSPKSGQENGDGGSPPDLCPLRNRVFNNSVFIASGASDGIHFIRDDPGATRASCVSQLSSANHVVKNNAIHDAHSSVDLFSAASFGCGGYGGNCANVQKNFLFSADTTPGVLDGSADDNWIAGGPNATDDGAAGIAGDISQLPGFNGEASSYTGDTVTAFTPTSAASKVCGRGDATTCAIGTGFNGAARTTCDIGAIPCPP